MPVAPLMAGALPLLLLLLLLFAIPILIVIVVVAAVASSMSASTGALILTFILFLLAPGLLLVHHILPLCYAVHEDPTFAGPHPIW